MLPAVLGTLISKGLDIINKYVPDPEAAAKAQLELMKLQQSSEFKQLEAELQEKQMQADINKVEAASDHMFVAGWRPFVGWICGGALAIQFLIFPLAAMVSSGFFGVTLIYPTLPTEMFATLLFGMLGIGGMRSWEKVKGIKNGGA